MKKPQLLHYFPYKFSTRKDRRDIPLEVYTPKARKIIDAAISHWHTTTSLVYFNSTSDNEPTTIFNITQNDEWMNNFSRQGTQYAKIFSTGEIFVTIELVVDSPDNESSLRQLEVESVIAKFIKQLKTDLKSTKQCREFISEDCSIEDLKMLEAWMLDKKKAMKKFGSILDKIVGHELDPLSADEMTTAKDRILSMLEYRPAIDNILGANTKIGYEKDIKEQYEKLEKIHERCAKFVCLNEA